MGALINDEFAGLDVSRQRRYQLRKQAKSLCTQCGDPSLPGMSRCKPCHIANYRRVQKFQGKPKKPRAQTKFTRALS